MNNNHHGQTKSPRLSNFAHTLVDLDDQSLLLLREQQIEQLEHIESNASDENFSQLVLGRLKPTSAWTLIGRIEVCRVYAMPNASPIRKGTGVRSRRPIITYSGSTAP